jgi:hypothetical protein
VSEHSYLSASAVAVVAVVLLAAGAAPSSASRVLGSGNGVARVEQQGHLLSVRVAPNSASKWNTVTVSITKHGTPVRRAAVTLTFAMIGMEMGLDRFRLRETRPGVYAYDGPALSMTGRWRLGFDVVPQAGGRIGFGVLDRVG